MPAIQIRCRAFGIRRSWENQIGHAEVAHGASQRRAGIFDFIAQSQRSFAHFMRGAGVTHDSGINFILMNYHGVIADGRRTGAKHEAWQNNEGIGFGDEKAGAFKIGNVVFPVRNL